MAAYDSAVVTRVIAQALAVKGRGSQTRLARELGVAVQTVNKWCQGQTCPEPERWAQIETLLDIPPGTIARESGFAELVEATTERPDTERRLDAIEERLNRLEDALRDRLRRRRER